MAVIIAIIVIAAKAMVTGLGLATGFAMVSGIPNVVNRVVEGRMDGKTFWQSAPPDWMIHLINGNVARITSPVEEPPVDHQQMAVS